MQITVKFFLAPYCQIDRVTEEAQEAGTAVWPTPFLINMFTAFNGSVLFLFPITPAGVVPCGGHKRSSRTSSIVQIKFVSFGTLRSARVF